MARGLKVLRRDRCRDRRRVGAIDFRGIGLPAGRAEGRIVEDRMIYVDEAFTDTILNGCEVVCSKLVYHESRVHQPCSLASIILNDFGTGQ